MNIYYVYHSAFLVEGKDHVLLFDYYMVPREKEKEKRKFLEKYIKQKEKRVYIFSSHSHADHFNPEILTWSQKNPGIYYILSSDISSKKIQNQKVYFVKEGDKISIEDLEIFVYGSTDLGVSFLVFMENKSIFHAGDFHLWHWEGDTVEEEKRMRDEFFRILQNIEKDVDFALDFVFFPVDPRLGEHTMEGLTELIKSLDIMYLIPMHFDEKDFVVEESRKLLESYAVMSPEFMETMTVIFGIFYKLEKDEKGYFIQLVDAYNRILSTDKIEMDPIYPYLPEKKENHFFSGWEKINEKTYLQNQDELLEYLEGKAEFVNAEFRSIVWKEKNEKLVLFLKNIQEREGYYQSGFEFPNLDAEIEILSDKVAIANGVFYNLGEEYTNFFSLKDLIVEVREEGVESLLTLAYNYFPTLQFRYRDYKMLEVADVCPSPLIIIEKISPDNSLYLRIGAKIFSMDYKFLQAHHCKKIVSLNTREKKIQVANLDLTKITSLLEELVKILVKLQRELGLRHGYYLDEDYFLILPENVAREFITKYLLQFANQYQISGTDKLKRYNIKAVKPKITGSFHYSIDFLEGKAEIDIEGEKFSIQEVLSSYQKDSYIVLSDGTNALINKRYIEKLERIFKEKDDDTVKISFFDLPIIDDIIEDKILNSEQLFHKNFFYGMNYLETYDVKLPKLRATLRSYQEYGFKWLSYLMEKRLGACLADDMGLGKTLQAIAVLTQLHSQKGKKSLIIMPKSLIFNWQSEIERFSPKLKIGIYYGNHRDLKIMKEEVILTTYGTVRNDIQTLQKMKFHLVILDESQNIKNIQSQTTKAVMLLDAENRIALSGTPIENNLTELYSLFRFLNPPMFGSLEDFNMTYAIPIQKENNLDAIQDLRKKIYPFILRRVKKDVLKDLPEKIEKIIYMEMNAEHKKFYQERRSYYYNMIHTNIQEKGLGKAQFFILQALNELRQITSCPETKNKYINSSKKEMLLEQIIEAVENEHKVLVFTNYIGSIESICNALEKEGILYLSMTGSTKERQHLVNKFQKDDNYKVFVMTLKTGGVGLNLTAADTIFIYDPWWNKTVENQAIDRAYRLGQDRTVFSYKLILKDSIEEKILQLQELKSKLLEDVISEDNLSNKSFTEKDIEFILGK